jgi:uncharacterized membrane protein YhaH (DUF805 family)
MDYQSLFVNPAGRTAREQFVPALLVLLAAVVFYVFVVTGRTAQFCALVLVYPGIVLHVRRLHDMGRSGWLVVLPAALMLLAFGVWLKYLSLGGGLDVVVPIAAIVVTAAYALWGCVGRARP